MHTRSSAHHCPKQEGSSGRARSPVPLEAAGAVEGFPMPAAPLPEPWEAQAVEPLPLGLSEEPVGVLPASEAVQT